MKKRWMAGLMLAFCLTTAAHAQQPTQKTSSANATPSAQRNTSSREGLERKGGKDVGTRGSAKMKDGVSRSGNSNLSPTSPSNPPPPGGDKPGRSGSGGGAAGGAASSGIPTATGTTAAERQKLKGTSTRNGNTAPSVVKPMQTDGSTSQGSASVPSPGGAVGTGTKTTRSVRPKSRSAMLEKEAKRNQPSAASLAGNTRKTGANGQTSPGSTSTRLTERGQKEGSYSDASKRNKKAVGVSVDPLKTGPNGQLTKPKKN